MASVGGIKGFYQEKKKGGVTKRSPKPQSAADPGCSPALKSARVQEQEETDERLREFDMDMRYGPCLGLTRMERWDRAASMGLNPPPDVEAILLKCSSAAALECLWVGRV